MYHSDKNPLKKVTYKSEKLYTPKNAKQRKVQKALLRYHDPQNWDVLRDSLKEMGHQELIGDGKNCLVPDENVDDAAVNSSPKRQDRGRGKQKQKLSAGGRPHSKQAKPKMQSKRKSVFKGKKAQQKSVKKGQRA
jgi:hypothetical protein